MSRIANPLAPGPPLGPAGQSVSGLTTLAVAVVIMAGLYVGREVFVPVAIAVLLSFVLAPPIRVLQRWCVPRAIAVVAVVLVAFLGLSALAGLMARQVNDLAGELPRYQSTLMAKVGALRGAGAGGGTLERAADMLHDLGRELDKPKGAAPAPNPFDTGAASRTPDEVKPIPVELRQPDPGALQAFAAFVAPMLHPLATAGIVVIFVVFILLQREDLRNRLIRLAGSHDLQKTTAAIDDAAKRLSRLFLIQLALNTAFGTIIGLGLWLIGVPSPLLWGILAGVFRFVPYVGALISAVFPLVLALAVDPGWSMLVWTAALFLVTEPVLGHVIEPLVYGHSTGLSPVAIVAAATFWTWLWGPVGLVLATPLTVCLVVLGRHVERLEFLDVMLGDRPPLSPPELFYQRMLAGDPAEAADTAEQFLKERSLFTYYEEVALAGLRLARADAERGVLDEERVARIRATVEDLVDNLADQDDAVPRGKATTETEAAAAVDATPELPEGANLPVLATGELKPEWREGTPVLCIAGRNQLDEAAALILAQLLGKHGLAARVEGAEALATQNIFRLDTAGVRLVCLSYLGADTASRVRYGVRRLRRKVPAAKILLCGWMETEGVDAAERLREAKADLAAASLHQAVAICLAEAGADIEDATAAAAPAPISIAVA